MFDLHITCSSNIKTLTLTFEEGKIVPSEHPEQVETKPKVPKIPDYRDTQELLTERLSKPKAHKNTVKLPQRVLTPDVIDLDRPIKVASELNNLEI